jgi:hypothetical protein
VRDSWFTCYSMPYGRLECTVADGAGDAGRVGSGAASVLTGLAGGVPTVSDETLL